MKALYEDNACHLIDVLLDRCFEDAAAYLAADPKPIVDLGRFRTPENFTNLVDIGLKQAGSLWLTPFSTAFLFSR